MGWLDRFAACAPTWKRIDSWIGTDFISDIDTDCVPGPVATPTGDVGKRPILFGGTAKAAGLSHWLTL